jgi:hypothetical protein
MRDCDNPPVVPRDDHVSLDFDELVSGRRKAPPAPVTESPRLTPRIYGVMALTTMLTFATLTTGYELFFQHQLFA